MHEKTVILSMPIAETDWLAGGDAADDCPELQIHGYRRWFFPDCVSYRVQSGVFEVIADAESTAEIYRFLEMAHLPAWPKAVQIYDHFRAFLRLPAKHQRADHLLVEIATIAGYLPSSSPIHTQGAFW